MDSESGRGSCPRGISPKLSLLHPYFPSAFFWVSPIEHPAAVLHLTGTDVYPTLGTYGHVHGLRRIPFSPV
jgi:hypothetical protein